MVVLNGINDDEIEKMICFARENQTILQLIELINVDTNFYVKHYFSLENIEKNLEKRASRIEKREMNARKQYFLDEVIVEVVKPHKKDFCLNCKKMRVTSDGRIMPCFMRKDNLFVFENENSIKKALEARYIYAYD